MQNKSNKTISKTIEETCKLIIKDLEVVKLEISESKNITRKRALPIVFKHSTKNKLDTNFILKIMRL